MSADVIIITEPGPEFRTRHPGALLAPELRQGGKKPESWVAMLGSNVEAVPFEIPYKHLAVAGTVTSREGVDVLVYGSILPWLSARPQASDVYGSTYRPFIDVFITALAQQVADMRRLQAIYPSHVLIWAGDFNHTLEPPFISIEASRMIESALQGLGLCAYNSTSPHREHGWHTLDLICAPESLLCKSSESFCPEFKSYPLSDHRSYVVELVIPA